MLLSIRRLVNTCIINTFPLNLLPRKLFNLANFFIASKFERGSVDYLPISMDVEPTTACNFKCTMCAVSMPDFTAKNMNIETFKKAIDDNPQLLKIKLQGLGEVLTNKQFFDMVKYAKTKGIVCETTTNGSLLNSKNINLLRDSGMSRIMVSIDGATKSTFEEIRVQSNFKVVVDGARQLIKQCNKKFLRPQISAWCVLQNSNYHEIYEIFELCRDMGFDDLSYQIQLTSWGGQEYWLDANKSKQINFNAEQVQNDVEKLKSLARDKNFALHIYEGNALTFEKQCEWPFRTSHITADGSIVPCALISDPEVVTLGNINEESYSTIWQSKDYKEFRENIKNNKLDDYCKDCYLEYR